MLKKAKAEAGMKPIEQAKELSQSVLNSSHQIWLAGLGAFARAQQEGMKMFDSLVRQGEHLEHRTRRAAADTADAARAKAKEVQEMAGGTWDKLEQVFEDRVARALSKLGVYTQNDVQRLADRVDELSAKVDALLRSGAKPPPRRHSTAAPALSAKPRAARKRATTTVRKRAAG